MFRINLRYPWPYHVTTSLSTIDFWGDGHGHQARGELFHFWRNPPEYGDL